MVGTLTATNFAASGPVANFADAVAAIRAGTTYFNIHTTAHPGGEIRGQIGVTVAAPAPSPTRPRRPPQRSPAGADRAPDLEPGARPPSRQRAIRSPSLALVGLLAVAGTLAWFGRRRSSETR